MPDLKEWLRKFDCIYDRGCYRYQPHITASTLNDYQIQSYTALHAAFVLFNGSINEKQERLYKFWLPSISNKLSLPDVIHMANKFNANDLEETIALFYYGNFKYHLLLDVYVFVSLGKNITEDFKIALNEWCHVLCISPDDFLIIKHLGDLILGKSTVRYLSNCQLTDNLIENLIWHEFYFNERHAYLANKNNDASSDMTFNYR